MGGISGILGGGVRGIVRAGAAGAALLIMTACATAPAPAPASEQAASATPEAPATDYSQEAAKNEVLEARVARLEHDLAQLRIDYSVVRPDMERIIARDGSVEYRVSAIEQALGFTTGSVSSSSPAPQPEPPQAGSTAPAAEPALDPGAAPGAVIVPPSPSPSPGYGVHLASYREEAALREGWRELREANADLLKGLEPQERLIDTGKDGLYRRLVAGPIDDKAAAARLCAAFKDRGIWCQTLPLDAE